jgi:hypothetical protein
MMSNLLGKNLTGHCWDLEDLKFFKVKATFGYLLSFFRGDAMILGSCRAVYSLTLSGSRRGLSRRRPET